MFVLDRRLAVLLGRLRTDDDEIERLPRVAHVLRGQRRRLRTGMDTAIFIGYNWVTVATYEASHDWKVMGHRPRVSPPNARTPANRC